MGFFACATQPLHRPGEVGQREVVLQTVYLFPAEVIFTCAITFVVFIFSFSPLMLS
jgi:hypothetical protein